jgi:3-hydroxyacyl-[acyl-carrier-protein] dehydratase
MKELYEITSGRENGIFEVRLNPAHAIFGGHFPEHPVLPGVCSLMIIRECASQMVGRPLRYASVRESKFLAAIVPDARLMIQIKLSNDGDSHTLDARICLGETTMLKLKARLIPDE